MTKLLVLYYSTYGHVETLAGAIADGAKSVEGVEVTVKRVAETMPPEVAAKHGAKLDQAAPVASPKELASTTRSSLVHQPVLGTWRRRCVTFSIKPAACGLTVPWWARWAVCLPARARAGGNESTIISFVTTLMHHGMIYVGLPYACPELADISEVKGGSPWGAATIAGADGSRQPSAKELAQAKFQGAHVAKIAKKLSS